LIADKLIKEVLAKLIASGSLTGALGTTGDISTRLRMNPLLKTLLKRRMSRHGTYLPARNITEIREKTLRYVESMRIQGRPHGQYRYSASNEDPVLYASTYACLVRHLYGDVDRLSEQEKREWVDYMQSHQSDDGLFRDPAIGNRLANSVDWWGWRHLTVHVTLALAALGAVAQRRFQFLERFRDRGCMPRWVESRRWKDNPANVSNEIQNFGTLLQYTRDFQGETWAENALNDLFDGLDAVQDSETGLWGNRFDTPALLSNGVQAGYHLWLLYFYDRKPLRFVERIVDNCLATQNELGGFGPFLNSSACEDIDSIDPLARLYFVTSYGKGRIHSSMERALNWVLANMNTDGGFVFRRYEPFLYGHGSMFSGTNRSAMFPTWFRTLSFAWLGKVLPSSIVGGFDWRFVECPGYQFWR